VAVVGAGIAWAVLKDNSPEMAPTNPTIFFLIHRHLLFWLNGAEVATVVKITPGGALSSAATSIRSAARGFGCPALGSSRKCRPAERKAAYGSKADFGRQLQACFKGLKNLML